MNQRRWTLSRQVWVAVWMVLAAAGFWGQHETAAQVNWTVPPVAPVLQNRGLECGEGFTAETNPADKETSIPGGWTVAYLVGAPEVWSTRMRQHEAHECGPTGSWVERLAGEDSLMVVAQDLEQLPEPGKPFDVVLYQQVPVVTYASYSLSGWTLSICGNQDRNAPFDCPEGYYIGKSIGLDPAGGTDPTAVSVIWGEENRVNAFKPNWKPTGFQKLKVGTMADGPMLTVFLRVTSPFQHHGNKAFLDDFFLIRSPLARFEGLPDKVEGSTLPLAWEGYQSPDIVDIPGGSEFGLYFDVQVRHVPVGEWRSLVVDENVQSQTFTAKCLDATYEFRVRANAHKEPEEPGVYSGLGFEGAWSVPQAVRFVRPPVVTPAAGFDEPNEKLFLPQLVKQDDC